jgi:hypothetical protein
MEPAVRPWPARPLPAPITAQLAASGLERR